MEPKQPLGLPEGSVRALLALLVIGTVCILTVLGRPVGEVMTGLAMGAFAAYHMGRSGGSPPTASAPVVTVVAAPPGDRPDPTLPSVLPA